MLQSFPLQDVELHVITICKKELAKCLKVQIYTDDKFMCKFRYVDIWNFFPVNMFPWSLNNIFLYNVKGNADICLTNVYIDNGIS